MVNEKTVSDIFAIESSDAAVGNRDPRVDTNFDGLGNGTPITDVFTQFSLTLADFGLETGNSLDLRITIDQLDTGDEDFAIDSLRLTGVNTVPEPSSMALILLVSATTMLRRRR